MAEQMKTFPLTLEIDERTAIDLLNYLKNCLDEVCERIAEKYGIYDGMGRLRKALVLEVLTRYTCPSCALKALTQMRARAEVDAIFREEHSLAISLLVHTLRHLSKDLTVESEVRCEYGRLDVLVKKANGGLVQLRANDREVVVEVKTNMGFSLNQALRYLIERPSATVVIWRVRKRQAMVIDGVRHRWLIMAFMAASLQHGLTILSGDFEQCNHRLVDGSFEVQNPQEMLDDFLSGLIESFPIVVNVVMTLLTSVAVQS
jgi:hypothetical protein